MHPTASWSSVAVDLSLHCYPPSSLSVFVCVSFSCDDVWSLAMVDLCDTAQAACIVGEKIIKFHF